MKIWLTNPYGPIPIPGEEWREYRFTILGNYLSSLGHEVTWYTSSFSHHFKKQRSAGWKDIEVNPKFKIRLVPTPGYKRNISFGRIYRDWVFAYKVYHEKNKINNKPDFIIYGESVLSFGFAGFKLAKFYKVPVIYDQMDLWPELMINSFPKKIQGLVNILFFPIFLSRKHIYNQFDGIISLAEQYLNAPLRFATKLKDKPHAVIYNGMDVVEFRKERTLDEEFTKLLPPKLEHEMWYVFAGTLGPSYDILNILNVAEQLINENNKNIRIILAGDGPLKEKVNEFIRKNRGEIITYLGQLKPTFLVDLYKQCDVGLSAYTEISNVEMPDKFYDYTAAGLPIINSLKGEVGQIIQKEIIGINYKAGNAKELYEAVITLSNDPSQRKMMAAKSFEAGLLYDKNNQIQKLGPLLNEIITSYYKNNK